MRSLNPLTWIEILRQVLVAAGFGSKNSLLRRGSFSKACDMYCILVLKALKVTEFVICR